MLKKLFVWGVMMLAGLATQAQVWTVTPASFTAEDRITISVDVTGYAALENEAPLYLWAWCNLGDANNGSWTSSDEAARMTQDPNNPKKWSISFVPATYYNKPAGQMTFIGFLAKGKDGSGTPERKTPDQSRQLEPIAFNDTPVRRFPLKFTEDDVLTIFYDKTLDNNITMKNTSDISIFTQVKVKDAAGVESNWVYTPVEWNDIATATPNPLRMTQIGDSLYRWTIIPRKFYRGLQPGETITRIKIHVRSTATPDFSGATGPAASKGDEEYAIEPKQ